MFGPEILNFNQRWEWYSLGATRTKEFVGFCWRPSGPFYFFLMGPLTGLCTGPLPALLWLSTSRQPCMIISIHLFAAIERV